MAKRPKGTQPKRLETARPSPEHDASGIARIRINGAALMARSPSGSLTHVSRLGAELMDSEWPDSDDASEAEDLSASRLSFSRTLVGEAHDRIAECLGDWDADDDIWDLAERDLNADWTHVMALLRGSMREYERSSLAEAS